jgi:hypothetical protein
VVIINDTMKFATLALDGEAVYESAQDLTMSREIGNGFDPYGPRLINPP